MENKMQDNQPLQKNSENKTSAKHTYAEDMAKMMRTDEASVIKVALTEQKHREQEQMKIKNRKEKGRNWIFIIGGIILVAGAIYALQIINQKTKVDSVHPQISTGTPSLIASDKQTIIPSDSFYSENDIAQALAKARNQQGTSGSVNELVFTKGVGSTATVLSASEFLNLIKSSITSNLENTLLKQMMVGIYTDTSATPLAHTFFIFQISNYDSAYAGSIAWEKTLLTEFFPLFGIDVTGTNAILLQKPFDNSLLNNQNIRVLNDTNGNPILYSVFLDNKFYMLTDSPDAIIEMTNRLHTSNTKPL